MTDTSEVTKPRAMHQPRKDVLREQLALSAQEQICWKQAFVDLAIRANASRTRYAAAAFVLGCGFGGAITYFLIHPTP